MLMDLISYDHRKQLDNPGKQQVCMECFFVPGSALCKTETVFKAVDGFFNIYTDLIGGIPFFRIPDGTGICPEALLGINVDHPSAGRIRAGILTVADTPFTLILFVVLPFHFGAYKLHSRQSATQMGFTSLPAHWKSRIMRAQRNTGFIDGIVSAFDLKLVLQRNVSFFDRGILEQIFINFNGIEHFFPTTMSGCASRKALL